MALQLWVNEAATISWTLRLATSKWAKLGARLMATGGSRLTMRSFLRRTSRQQKSCLSTYMIDPG